MSSVYQPTGVASDSVLSVSKDRVLSMSKEVRLAAIAASAMGGDPEFVSVRLAGRRLVLQGMAPSYEAKTRASASLRLAGYPEVENCLRVAPGTARAVLRSRW